MSDKVVREIKEILSLCKEDEAQFGALEHYLSILLQQLDQLSRTMKEVLTGVGYYIGGKQYKLDEKDQKRSMRTAVTTAMWVWRTVSRTESQQDRKSKKIVRRIETLKRIAQNENLSDHFGSLLKEFNIERNILLRAMSRYGGEIKDELNKIESEEGDFWEKDRKKDKVFEELGQRMIREIENFEEELKRLIEVTDGAIATLRKIEKSCPKAIEILHQTHEHPNANDISAESSSEHAHHTGADSRYAYTFHYDKKAERFLKRKLRGSTLIDLGCGAQKTGTGIARSLEVSTYLGVDKAIRENYMHYPQEGMKILAKGGDMLVFVSKLPSHSVHFLINGIDMYILKGQKYITMLIEEISRTIMSKGVVFGRGSEPIQEALERSDQFEDRTHDFDLGLDGFLFVKK